MNASPQHRAAHVVTVDADAPRVVHVVALGDERILQPHVLIEPVARGIVLAVGVQAVPTTTRE